MPKKASVFLENHAALILRITAGISIIIAILFIMVSAEMFDHGAVFTFLGYITLLLNIIGIVGGILVLRSPSSEFAAAVLRSFCVVGLLFILFFSAVSNEFQFGLIFFVIFWVIVFILFSLPPIRRFMRSDQPDQSRITMETASLPRGTYLRIHPLFIVFVLSSALLFILIWVIDWEAQTRIYSEPNGGGISSYVSESNRPAITVNVDGGFIYNTGAVLSQDSDSPSLFSRSETDFCGEIKLKMTAPSAQITVYPYESGTLRMVLLNMPRYGRLILNGEEKRDGLRVSESRWTGEETITGTVDQILSARHLTLSNGVVMDVDITAGETMTLEILPGAEKTDQDSFRFAVLSDLHSGYNIFVPELVNILRNDADFLVINGDFTNLGYPAEYMMAAATTEILPIPVYPTIGNHDVWNGGSTSYNKYYGPFSYSFVFRETKFIFLDSSSGIIGENQFNWLIGELENNDSSMTFVFSHMAPIDTVTGSFDTSNTLHPETLHTIHSKSESDYLLRLMTQYGVDVFFAGHSHYHGRVEIGGTTYITSGVLGGTVKPGNDVCYLEVEVYNGQYTMNTIDVLSSEEASEKETENRFQAIRVFSIPFLINNSVRIASTLLLLIIIGMLWVPIRQRLVYRSKNRANNKIDTVTDREDLGI